MKHLMCLLLLLSASMGSTAQDKKTVLIIDSIQGPTEHFSIERGDRPGKTMALEPYMFYLTDISQSVPNIVVVMDSMLPRHILRLSLDDRGGYLEINVAHSTDTIRISKYTVYPNCIRDSVYFSKATYKMLPPDQGDSIVLVRYEKEEKLLAAPCHMTAPERITLLINGKEYTAAVSVNREKAGLITHGHGYPHKRDQKRKYNNATKHKPYQYFHFSKTTKTPVLSASIEL